jgi:cytochrome b561
MADIPSPGRDETYTSTARRFHWWTVALVAVQIPVGVYMVYRGQATNFDALTNTLYSSHKTLGIVILLLVVARLVYRFAHGAPADEPTLEPWQKAASHANHWSLYLLLLVVPILGYIGISLYPALDLFGIVPLPGIVAPDEDPGKAAAKQVLFYHWLAAVVLVALVAMHVGAALFHYLIRRDGVLARMLPQAGRWRRG